MIPESLFAPFFDVEPGRLSLKEGGKKKQGTMIVYDSLLGVLRDGRDD